ncbi:hypothetical protein L1987_87509 [Smallanthus sonchifolius]|nr:hypothetical protein L1987_87509 [Smallanthus sonchifolius]
MANVRSRLVTLYVEIKYEVGDVLKKRKLHSVTCQSEEIKQESSYSVGRKKTEEGSSRLRLSYDDVTFVGKAVTVGAEAAGRVWKEREESLGNPKSHHVNLSSTSDPEKREDKVAEKVLSGSPVVDKGKTMLVEGENLSSASDNWFEEGVKVRNSRMCATVDPKEAEDMFVPEWRIRNKHMISSGDLARDYLYNVTTPADYASVNQLRITVQNATLAQDVAMVAKTAAEQSRDEALKVVEKLEGQLQQVSEEKTIEVEMMAEHVEQTEKRCDANAERCQQLPPENKELLKKVASLELVGERVGVLEKEKEMLVKEKEWWYQEGFGLFARTILSSPAVATCVGGLNNAMGDMGFMSGLVAGYANAAKNVPIVDVPDQPEDLDSVVDAAVAAFEAVKIPLVKQLSAMVTVPLLEVQALVKAGEG